MSFSHRTNFERNKYSYYSPRIPARSQVIYQLTPHTARHAGLLEGDSEYSLRLFTFRPLTPEQSIEIISTDAVDLDRSLKTVGMVARSLKNPKPGSEQENYINYICIHRIH